MRSNLQLFFDRITGQGSSPSRCPLSQCRHFPSYSRSGQGQVDYSWEDLCVRGHLQKGTSNRKLHGQPNLVPFPIHTDLIRHNC